MEKRKLAVATQEHAGFDSPTPFFKGIIMKHTPNIKRHRKRLQSKKRFVKISREHNEVKKKRAIRQSVLLHELGKIT